MRAAPPLTLAQMQQAFKRHLMQRDPAIVSHITSDDKLGAATRLAIYSHAYYARLEEALAQDYEAVHTLLGDEAFSELCVRYTNHHPSEFPSLRWFGQYMSEFLGTEEPYCRHPYIAELAHFEWTLVMAFDAADAAVASNEDLAKVAPEHWPQLTLTLHPSVHTLPFRWNILPLWRAATEDGNFPDIQPLPAEQHCLIWRHDLVTRFRTLSTEELTFLQGVVAGENFSQLCERLADASLASDQVPLMAASIMKTWINQGMVTQFGI